MLLSFYIKANDKNLYIGQFSGSHAMYTYFNPSEEEALTTEKLTDVLYKIKDKISEYQLLLENDESEDDEKIEIYIHDLEFCVGVLETYRLILDQAIINDQDPNSYIYYNLI